MAKIIVEIDMGRTSAEAYMEMLEANKEAFFPAGNNLISIRKDRLLADPVNSECVLFKLMGVFDESKEDPTEESGGTDSGEAPAV